MREGWVSLLQNIIFPKFLQKGANRQRLNGLSPFSSDSIRVCKQEFNFPPPQSRVDINIIYVFQAALSVL